MIRRFLHSIIAVALLLTSVGCSDTVSKWFGAEDGDLTGEPITFTSQLPVSSASSATRADETYTADKEFLKGYSAVNQAYSFKITMQKSDGTKVGEATYDASEAENNGGELSSTAPLYWQDNVSGYGFYAEAGTKTLEPDQTTKEKWLKQDRLTGYGYEPLLNTASTAVDKTTEYNYHINKEWYKYNQLWKDQLGLSTTDDYKRVPLFLQHARSLVTVILKAGDGVKREDVLAATAANKIVTDIYSYTKTEQDESTDTAQLAVTPLLGSETVHYEKDANGDAADNVVARYDAIVEPYNYASRPEDDKICSINLGSQHFSFYASNDKSYVKDELPEAFKTAYNLQAGDNLVLTVTLSRDSRKILMSAYVQDWTEAVTTYVCDDFGSSGDRTIINTKQDLETFLKSDDNKAGNVAILNANGIELDDWASDYTLNATFNLGNHSLTATSTLFKSISSSGNLINGTLMLKNSSADVATLVCDTNEGTVDHLTLTDADTKNRGSVTRAAVAVTNKGYITNVTSTIRVNGKSSDAGGTTYVGGIAAISQSPSASVLASINNCTVEGKVSVPGGTEKVYGGGIVGCANGYVQNNTYEYGVTISQNTSTEILVRNIVHTHLVYAETNVDLSHKGNAWPTNYSNSLKDGDQFTNARAKEDQYDGVIDSQKELRLLVAAGSNYNVASKKYRIADNFTVSSGSTSGETTPSDDDWPFGKKNDNKDAGTRGNVLFTLDGNDKTITLTGTGKIKYKETENGEAVQTNTSASMLFNNIMGTVKNLQLNIAESLYSLPEYSSGNITSQDVCAPLAYAVIGGTVENVKVHAVKNSKGEYPKIVAAIVGGMVVWACDGATIKNCTSDIDVDIMVGKNVNTELHLYAGGLVAEAAHATITQCQYAPIGEDDAFMSHYAVGKSYASSMCFFGGIVGGTVHKDYQNGSTTEYPALTLTDCSSWYTIKKQEGGSATDSKGAIIGRARYYIVGQTSTFLSGIKEGQGNWWGTGIAGVGLWTSSVVNFDEKAIGKRNAVIPDEPKLDD